MEKPLRRELIKTKEKHQLIHEKPLRHLIDKKAEYGGVTIKQVVFAPSTHIFPRPSAHYSPLGAAEVRPMPVTCENHARNILEIKLIKFGETRASQLQARTLHAQNMVIFL